MKNISFKNILFEQGILKTSKNKVLVKAITNRNPITFWYSGPRKQVKAGRRIEGEPVALGLSKRGNLILRTYVQPPSVSKKGFEKHGWRTFIVGRMSKIDVNEEKTFDIQRDLYKDGDDGSMTVTYVTSDWGKKEKTIEPEAPQDVRPEPEVPQDDRPEVPQDVRPEPEAPQDDRPVVPQDVRPPANPEQLTKDFISDIYNNTIQNKVTDVDGQKTLSLNDYENSVKELYNLKRNDWINYQREIGGNTSPGEGTRKRMENESKIEIDKKLSDQNIMVTNNQLQENINRIKCLML